MSPANALPAYAAAAEELRENENQWKAYESSGNFVVLAGPGSGKTKVLTIKMARMLAEDVRMPRGMACLTYNAECARELTARCEALSIRDEGNVFIGTVHGFCLSQVLRPYARLTDLGLPLDFAVADQATRTAALQRSLDDVLDRPAQASDFQVTLERYRRTHLDRSNADWHGDDEETALVIERYEELLHSKDFIDFDDMTLGGLRAIQEHTWIRQALIARFPILLVDEYQDLGQPLHELVTALKDDGARVFAVGDPDQSIYGFTGAKPELLVELSTAGDVESTRLRLNYRSRRAIVRGAQIVLQEERDYEAVDPREGLIEFIECPNGLEEQAEVIIDQIIPRALEADPNRSLSDIAVLYANRNIGEVIATAASAKGLNYVRMDQGAPYPKTPFSRWLEDCAAWCAGGWSTGSPSVSAIFRGWAALRQLQSRDATWSDRVSLIGFLWSHRGPDVQLTDWLGGFFDALLENHVGGGSPHRDDVETWRRVLSATSSGRLLDGATIQQFGHQIGNADQLNLITLHSCKGLEFQVVVMMGMDQGIVPSWSAGPGGKQEHRRLFYVGLTRAKHEVYMTYSGYTVSRYGTVRREGPSEFVIELQHQLDQ